MTSLIIKPWWLKYLKRPEQSDDPYLQDKGFNISEGRITEKHNFYTRSYGEVTVFCLDFFKRYPLLHRKLTVSVEETLFFQEEYSKHAQSKK